MNNCRPKGASFLQPLIGRATKVGLNISPFSTSLSITRPGSASRSSVGSLEGRLDVTPSSSVSRSSSSLSSERLSERSVTLRLSTGASAVNTREDLTQRQNVTITELLARAKEIKREANPTRADELANEASALIDSSEEQFAEAQREDSTIGEAINFRVEVDSSVPTGNSGGDFNTTISGVQSLANLGVTSNLSFAKEDIDDTITTLESAQSALSSSLSGFASSRSDLSNEVRTRTSEDNLKASAEGDESIEAVADRLASEIAGSAERLVVSQNVEQLNVQALLTEEVRDENDDEQSNQTDV